MKRPLLLAAVALLLAAAAYQATLIDFSHKSIILLTGKKTFVIQNGNELGNLVKR